MSTPPTTTKTPLTSHADQPATFVELFFDLVFVFAISKITHHAWHHMDPGGLAFTAVVFWLLWWAWTQFTWALNGANTDRHDIRLMTLIATAVAFLMATSVDLAFTGGPVWFAVPYVIVRAIGLWIYLRVASAEPEILASVRRFALASVPGLAAVLAGAFCEPGLRIWVWTGAVLLDIAAAWSAGGGRAWNLRVKHFAERHGLILIIALGESLIVAGAALADAPRTAELVAASVLVAAMACLLWWTYFGWVMAAMEHGLEAAPTEREGEVARDSYTLLHFPLICGVVAFAAGALGLLQAPAGPTSPEHAFALATGIFLFVVSTALALWRATGVLALPRVVITAVASVVVCFLTGGPAWLPLATACAALVAVILIEHLRPPSCKLTKPRTRGHTA